MIGFQYNELAILRKLFADKFCDLDINDIPIHGTNVHGMVIEIGAADGVDNSNSYELIRHGWQALLVEPHPGYFMDLLLRYSDHPRVRLSSYAISDKDCRKILGIDGQCSSLVYKKPHEIQVQCVTLTNLFKLYKVPHTFEFLSIDCEGEDMNVLRSLDWAVYQPQVVCVEHSMPQDDLLCFMDTVGYKRFDRNTGNTFFVRK